MAFVIVLAGILCIYSFLSGNECLLAFEILEYLGYIVAYILICARAIIIAIHPFSIVPVVIHEYGHYKHLNLLFSLIIQAKVTMNSINCHKRSKISSIVTNTISIKG